MAEIAKLVTRKPDEGTVANLEKLLERAKRGDITDVVIVGSSFGKDGEPVYYSFTSVDDFWRLLAALEYAKAMVTQRMITHD